MKSLSMIAATLLTLAACSGSDGGGQVKVDYIMSLTDTNCGHEFGDVDGYSDIATGTEVEVFDGGGQLLGFGSLGKCGMVGGNATYPAVFEINESGDGIYRVTAGNTNRGFLNYADDDVIDGTLVVLSSLG